MLCTASFILNSTPFHTGLCTTHFLYPLYPRLLLDTLLSNPFTILHALCRLRHIIGHPCSPCCILCTCHSSVPTFILYTSLLPLVSPFCNLPPSPILLCTPFLMLTAFYTTFCIWILNSAFPSPLPVHYFLPPFICVFKLYLFLFICVCMYVAEYAYHSTHVKARG